MLTGGRRISYTDVRVEQHFHDIVPDIIVSAGGTDLIIEVFVTNKVRDAKAEKIRRQNLRAIEVDVRYLRHVLDRAEIKNQIIEETDHKAWLYTPEFETDLPPPPTPIYRPPPPKILDLEPAESAESIALRVQRLAEAEAVYKPPTPYVVQRRLGDELRAKMMSQAPAMCKKCGALTTNWASIECETGLCICRSCVSKAKDSIGVHK